jgi:hypothetical protein
MDAFGQRRRRVALVISGLLILASTACGETTPPVEGYADISALRVVVEQIYPQIEQPYSQPITGTVVNILQELGHMVLDDIDEADATLTITLTGTGERVTYGSSRCYTKAVYEGQLTLTAPGRAPLEVPLEGSYIPIVARSCPLHPISAPFDNAWPEIVLDGLSRVWGQQLLIVALEDEDEDCDVRRGAVEVLKELGLDAKESVPALIQALIRDEQDHCALGYSISIALHAITGEYCSEDVSCWQGWWEQYQ